MSLKKEEKGALVAFLDQKKKYKKQKKKRKILTFRSPNSKEPKVESPFLKKKVRDPK
jgi:hypothetical protein